MSKSCSLRPARSSMRGTAYAGAISMPSFGPAMPTKSTAAVSAAGDVGQRLEAARARPFFGGEQHAGGAVGERRAVAGGERAGGRRIEGGAQRRQLLQRGVAAHVVVALEVRGSGHEVVEESREPRRGGVLVAGERELVLLLARRSATPSPSPRSAGPSTGRCAARRRRDAQARDPTAAGRRWCASLSVQLLPRESESTVRCRLRL